ncbi:MAG: TauD/TfdA family dioxygenase [Bradyrhizobiaceae bacterium]|nr:TauD/TfdA family dioxygenase [Bradyrhizobiaceae bacterium]
MWDNRCTLHSRTDFSVDERRFDAACNDPGRERGCIATVDLADVWR